MHRIRILPRLTLNSMKKSASSYLPYIFATSFAVFVFFVFSAIAGNPIMQEMPHAAYLIALMQVGKVLLGIILVPFLFYTNSFLMKRRRREMGLYSILGLEKKHIGMMVAAETMAACIASLTLGIVMALVFSKLIFLLLLNITKLPVNIDFAAGASAYIVTAAFFGSIFLLNLLINLVQVFRARPADLFQSARQGEKQPKRLWPSTLIGLATLGGGYYLAFNFRLNSNFLLDFFGAVALVIIGTYCLFTSGIVTILRQLKKNPKHYYRKNNFVTVSGMLYRMRKNAASLSNICIFSTMVIITLVCTISLFFGLGSISHYKYPYDVDLRFVNSEFTQREQLHQQVQAQAAQHGVTLTDHIEFEYVSLLLSQSEGQFQDAANKDTSSRPNVVRVMRLEDYNRVEHTQKTLEPGELLVFSTGKDINLTNLSIGEQPFHVKEELQSLRFERKEPNSFDDDYYFVVAGGAQDRKSVV